MVHTLAADAQARTEMERARERHDFRLGLVKAFLGFAAKVVDHFIG
ncbi:hypothetical protein AB0F71_31735 [Kitasatospora sp. NPDC028055]